MSTEEGSNDWCTVESDPGVFTEMLESMGCSTVELEELWSLDDESLQRLKEASGKVHGLVFLFKWMGDKQKEHADAKEPLEEVPPNLFFAHQVTTNACATQAILSVVFNAGLSEQDMGSTLSEFQSFTASFPPNLKGVAISSSDEIKTAHNRFARSDAFLHDGVQRIIPTEKDEAFHFVAYVPKENTVYELDGLQKGPIVAGTVEDGADWLTTARAAIQERMTKGGDHIKFNLMAVIQDKRIKLKERLQGLADQSSDEYNELVAQLAAENSKREQWKLENQRRRHNYVPLCVQLLKEMARMGNLPTLISEAKERHAAKRKVAETASASS